MLNNKMEAANLEFYKYSESLIEGSNEEIEDAYSSYQLARNAITSDIYKKENKKWIDLTNEVVVKKYGIP